MSSKALCLVEPDAFIGKGEEVASYIPDYRAQGRSKQEYADKQLAQSQRANFDDIAEVSRPTRGITAKPNTHAFVQVLREDGTPVMVFNKLGTDIGTSPFTDPALRDSNGLLSGADPSGLLQPSASDDATDNASGAPASTAWTDWILQSVREQRIEKTQVVETFGDTYIYAFGERPRALEFRGILMNTADYNWRAVFWENWDKFFRATKLIERNARVYIGWDDIIVEGYPINAAAAELSDSPNAMTFQFTFYVTNYINTAAQSNFLLNKSAKIATIRGGFDLDLVATRETVDRRNRVIEYLGAYGLGIVGNAAAKQAGGAANPAFSSFVGKTAAGAAAAAKQGAYALLQSDAAAMTFLNSYTTSLAWQTTKYWTNHAVTAAEDLAGFQHGEINQWFGYIGQIVGRMDKGSSAKAARYRGGTAVPGETSANWIGDPSKKFNMLDALKVGSLDRVIYGLGIGALNESGVGYGKNSSVFRSASPTTATMVHLGPVDSALQQSETFSLDE